jgi:hypothetical protein
VTRLAASAGRLFGAGLAPAQTFCRDAPDLPRLAVGEGRAVFDAGAIRQGDRDERGRPLVGRCTGLGPRTAHVQGGYARLRALGVRLADPPEAQPRGGRLPTF